jgi:hypothetical protein
MNIKRLLSHEVVGIRATAGLGRGYFCRVGAPRPESPMVIDLLADSPLPPGASDACRFETEQLAPSNATINSMYTEVAPGHRRYYPNGMMVLPIKVRKGRRFQMDSFSCASAHILRTTAMNLLYDSTNSNVTMQHK